MKSGLLVMVSREMSLPCRRNGADEIGDDDVEHGVLGMLQEDMTAAVLVHVPAPALMLCSAVNRPLREMADGLLSTLTELDLSLRGNVDGEHIHGLDTFAACASVRKACQSSQLEALSHLPSVSRGGQPLCAQSLRSIIRRLPSLTTLSLRGRLLVPTLRLRACVKCEEGLCDEEDCECRQPGASFR